MRVLRTLQYVAYVVVLSFAEGLSTAAELMQVDTKMFHRGEFAFLVVMAVPYVLIQLVIAVVAIRALSLAKLFALTLAIEILQYGVVFLSGQGLGPASGWLWTAYGLLESPFLSLLVPVLVLALVERWCYRVRSAASAEASEPSLAAGPADEPETRGGTAEAPPPKRPWYYWDFGLAALPLYFAILMEPFGILHYLGGLFNVPVVLFALLASVTLLPLAWVCAILLLVRMVVAWPRRIAVRRRLFLAWGAAAVVAMAIAAPRVVRVGVPLWQPYTRGLRRYMQVRADTEAIQAWLRGIDSSDPDWARGDVIAEACRLPAIARLQPKGVNMEHDDTHRPMVRLSWGSGIMGSWGLVVGREDMEIPKTKEPGWREYQTRHGTQRLRERGEYRLPVAAGAYVWYEIE